MKLKCIDTLAVKNEIKYPVIAVNKIDGDLVVLFTGLTEGIMLSKPQTGSGRKIGIPYTWVGLDDGALWNILPKGTEITFTI